LYLVLSPRWTWIIDYWWQVLTKRFTCNLAQRNASSGVRGVGKTARTNSSSSSSSVRGARLLSNCSASVTLTGRSPGWTHFSRDVVDIDRGRFSTFNIFAQNLFLPQNSMKLIWQSSVVFTYDHWTEMKMISRCFFVLSNLKKTGFMFNTNVFNLLNWRSVAIHPWDKRKTSKRYIVDYFFREKVSNILFVIIIFVRHWMLFNVITISDTIRIM